MQDFKPYLRSRTVWANIVGLSALLLDLLGYAGPSPETQGELVQAILKMVELGGFVFGTYFRAVASKKLYFLPLRK